MMIRQVDVDPNHITVGVLLTRFPGPYADPTCAVEDRLRRSLQVDGNILSKELLQDIVLQEGNRSVPILIVDFMIHLPAVVAYRK